MFVSTTRILQKEGKSSTNWRQVTLLTNNDETQFEVREYYGQKKTSYMREVLRLSFDVVGVAILNFKNIVSSRIIDGYERVESLSTDAANVPFVVFKPPAFKHSSKTTYVEQFQNTEKPAAIEVPVGDRLYIRFGCESLSSIKAVTSSNQPVELSLPVSEMILEKVKIGQIENGVIECYVYGSDVVITDISSINGLEIKLPYCERLQRAKEIFGFNSDFDYPKIMTTLDELKNSKANYFLVKQNTHTTMAGGCFTIPNFYTVACVVLNVHRTRKNIYTVYFWGEEKENYIKIGTFRYPQQINEGSRVHIGFNQLENGMPARIWLSPFQPYKFDNTSEDGIEVEQMQNYKDTWVGL